MKKLVRDNIPNIIKSKGEKADFYIADKEEYEKELYKKLIEESKEFAKDPSKEEFIDILEVMDAIGKLRNFDKKEVIELKNKKAKEKGKLEKRFILKLNKRV